MLARLLNRHRKADDTAIEVKRAQSQRAAQRATDKRAPHMRPPRQPHVQSATSARVIPGASRSLPPHQFLHAAARVPTKNPSSVGPTRASQVGSSSTDDADSLSQFSGSGSSSPRSPACSLWGSGHMVGGQSVLEAHERSRWIQQASSSEARMQVIAAVQGGVGMTGEALDERSRSQPVKVENSLGHAGSECSPDEPTRVQSSLSATTMANSRRGCANAAISCVSSKDPLFDLDDDEPTQSYGIGASSEHEGTSDSGSDIEADRDADSAYRQFSEGDGRDFDFDLAFG